jgi:SNF2 family DNA or RNA helicase
VFDFQWQVAVGGAALSLPELRALAALKVPLVRVRGQWVEVDAARLGEVLAGLEGATGGRTSAGEVVRMALGAGRGPAGLEVEGVAASGWVGDLLARLQGRAAFAELPPPAGLRAVLRPYQVRGYSWLAFLRGWGLGACLADDMGLGKTVQALALVQRDWETLAERRPVLLVCPTSVVGNWQKEAGRFTPDLPVLVHHGAGRRRAGAFREAAEGHALVVSTYALLQRDLAALAEVEWRGVILDEAQNVKNPETRQARAARALTTGYRVALTGTPVENHVGDLWSLMEFLNPGLLGSQAEFRRRYFLPIQVQGDAAAAERLRRLTGPFVLRRLKTDRAILAELPEKQEMKVYATLTREQASLYAAVLEEASGAIAGSQGIERKGLILALLTRLKQVCNHPAHFLADGSAIAGRSGKLALLEEILAEVLEAGECALVFTQFAEMGALLKARLQEVLGCEVPFLHGAVPKPRRDELVERFQAPGGPPVFVLSLKAGGTGLNLTRASQVVHYDRWWNPAVEDQATDRVFRIGQTRNVQVRKLICVGTFEERIDLLLESKHALARQVIGTGEGWLTRLSDRELRAVLALDREAVGG